MKELEWFSSIRIPTGMWPIIRCDGRGFSKVTANLEKPFDEKFHKAICFTAETLLREFNGLYAYTQSDEISILLSQENDLFDRRIEKLVSVASGISTCAFSSANIGELPHFDARVCLAADQTWIIKYFYSRLNNSYACAVSGWTYWTLRQSGLTQRQATNKLKGMDEQKRKNLLAGHGIDIETKPLWQVRGTGFYVEEYEKTGWNPILNQEVIATRKKIVRNESLPEDYTTFLIERLPK